MPRQNRRRLTDALPARPSASVGERREDWGGERYVVRGVTASGAVKAYRCPGCDQEVRPGVPHVVTWPAFDNDAGDRRHWHTPCWAARDRRAPGVQRGRAAPRF
jgi:hypothetical protein